MMGRLKSDQGQLFYEFRLGDAVPEDHMVRKIDICRSRLRQASNRDSVVLTRIAARSIHDGPSEE